MSDETVVRPGTRFRAGVLGSPIAHSLSPALHRAAYVSLGLSWEYDAYEVTSEALPAFLSQLDESWAGLSLTRPLKESVIPLLTGVDIEARRIRSVNTVLPRAEGGWRGVNTDVYGMVESLARAGLDRVPTTATVLGAGATARSAVAALARLGTTEVTICARRPDAVMPLVDLAAEMGVDARGSDLTPRTDLVAADLLMSTLPGDVAAPWAEVAASVDGGALLDASYHPWPTPLASAWRGSVIASGRDMLLWQAVEQVRLMTGQEPSVEAMAIALDTTD